MPHSTPTSDHPYQTLSDRDLLDLIYTAGDRLPREAVEEILQRRARLTPELCSVMMDKAAWTQPLPEWWAVVHATYIVGAMENPDLLVCLLSALRWADAFDCDWVTEDLPSIFGHLGAAAYPALMAVSEDTSAGPGARSIALTGLAAVALREPVFQEQVLEVAAAIVADSSESLYLRQSAANLLMDFRSEVHTDLLLTFGREEAERRREDPEYQGVFYDWEVNELLHEDVRQNLEYYRRDWLLFYEPEEIERRQQRWLREQETSDQSGSEAPLKLDLQAPCSCGSGRPFAQCCYLRVH